MENRISRLLLSDIYILIVSPQYKKVASNFHDSNNYYN